MECHSLEPSTIYQVEVVIGIIGAGSCLVSRTSEDALHQDRPATNESNTVSLRTHRWGVDVFKSRTQLCSPSPLRTIWLWLVHRILLLHSTNRTPPLRCALDSKALLANMPVYRQPGLILIFAHFEAGIHFALNSCS